MRKNRRAIQLSFVKSPVETSTTAPEPVEVLNPDAINAIAKEQIHNIAVAVGATILTTLFAGAASEILVHTAKTKIK